MEPNGFIKLHHELKKNFILIGPRSMRGIPAEDLEEIFQEVNIAIINNISGHSSELGCLSWVRAIVHHKTVDYFRRNSLSGMREDYIVDDFGAIDASIEVRDELKAALDELEEEETNLLLEVKLFGRTFKEMSLLTGKKQGALKVALHRTLKKIHSR